MSQFQEKVFAACAKKEALFNESLGRYALRSMLAGGLSYHVNCGRNYWC